VKRGGGSGIGDGDVRDSPLRTDAPARRAGSPAWRWLLALAALAALLLVGRLAGDAVPRFARWVEGLGPWGPIAFVLGYVVAVVAFVPGSLLTLAAGAIFGIGAGTLYVFVAASVGAALAFLVARHLARGAVERRLAGDARFAAVDRAVGEQGLKIVLLLRLSPVFPFNLLNYALGLTRVRFSHYLVACLGMLPGTLLYVYSGKVAGDVAALAGGAGSAPGAGRLLLFGAGLLATIAVTALVTRIARRALAEATAP
jgi:uncharacterized membrane protein YdjX (TVP38/TMEM64 family)